MTDRLRAVPAWAWLALIVVGSAALRLWLVRGMAAPFIFVDELIYSELGRSLAEGNGYSVRGLPITGYSLLYPLLIAPAYLVFDALPDAYGAAKAIGAVTMSLAAIPAFLIARRLMRLSFALVAAATTVLVPSMAYTGTLTTEALFYPVALTFAWLLLRYVEMPNGPRLLLMLAGLGVAYATRVQSLQFLPAIATAPIVLALLQRRRGVLRPFVPLYCFLAIAGVLVVGGQAVRGRSPSDLLGAYSIVGDGGYDVRAIARMWLWNVEELDLYSGILPFAALFLLLALSRAMPPRVRELLAVTVSLVVWSTLAVATFASRFASERVQDRYLFFLIPLLVVTLLAWVEVGAPRPRVAATVSAAAALALALLFPFVKFIGEPARSDTLGLLQLWSINEHLVLDRYWVTVGVVGIALVALFLFVPARAAIAVPLAVLVLFAVVSRSVWSGPHGFRASGAGALFQGIQGTQRDWIDRAVPKGQEVVVLWTGRADRFTVNQNEFFNRRVGNVYYTGTPTPGGINESRVALAPTGTAALPTGVYTLPSGRPILAPYALLDGSIVADGVVVARDEKLGTTLWRLTGPLSSRATVTGLYADGNWSGRTATWQLLRCRAGTLTAAVRSDPSLFTTPQTVVAISGDRRAAVRFAPDERGSLSIPVAPDERGTCVVRFVVTPTAIPADVIPGSTDARVLGVHFDAFAYEPR